MTRIGMGLRGGKNSMSRCSECIYSVMFSQRTLVAKDMLNDLSHHVLSSASDKVICICRLHHCQ